MDVLVPAPVGEKLPLGIIVVPVPAPVGGKLPLVIIVVLGPVVLGPGGSDVWTPEEVGMVVVTDVNVGCADVDSLVVLVGIGKLSVSTAPRLISKHPGGI